MTRFRRRLAPLVLLLFAAQVGGFALVERHMCSAMANWQADDCCPEGSHPGDACPMKGRQRSSGSANADEARLLNGACRQESGLPLSFTGPLPAPTRLPMADRPNVVRPTPPPSPFDGPDAPVSPPPRA